MSTQNLTEEVKKRSAWSIFMGIVTSGLGCFLIVYPMATAAITTVLLGWALIFVGLAQFVFALYSQTIGSFLLKVLLSLLYGICGIALAFFPIAGVAALTVSSWNPFADPGGTAHRDCVPTETCGWLGMVSL